MVYLDRLEDYTTLQKYCVIFHWVIHILCIVFILTFSLHNNIYLSISCLLLVTTKELHSSIWYSAEKEKWDVFYSVYNYTSIVALFKHFWVALENIINKE